MIRFAWLSLPSARAQQQRTVLPQRPHHHRWHSAVVRRSFLPLELQRCFAVLSIISPIPIQ